MEGLWTKWGVAIAFASLILTYVGTAAGLHWFPFHRAAAVAITSQSPSVGNPVMRPTANPRVPTTDVTAQLANYLPGGVKPSSCDNVSIASVGVVAGLQCNTASRDITLYAYEFDNEQDYSAGLSMVNTELGWDPAGAGSTCTRTENKGKTTWHNSAYPEDAAQIEECFYGSEQPIIVWALPVRYNIYFVRGVRGISLAFLDNWFSEVGGGIPP
jgi:hypothetical protein